MLDSSPKNSGGVDLAALMTCDQACADCAEACRRCEQAFDDLLATLT